MGSFIIHSFNLKPLLLKRVAIDSFYSERSWRSGSRPQIIMEAETSAPIRSLHAKVNGRDRQIVCTDAMLWLKSVEKESLVGSVFTSLPDVSELPGVIPGKGLKEKAEPYKEWFTDVAATIMEKIVPGSCAIFLQSDIRIQDTGSLNIQWIDKSFLCSSGAERSGCKLLWHKIVLSTSMDRRSHGRPGYSHLLCYGKDVTYFSGAFATPDVFERGEMLWQKGIGLDCCLMGIAFLKEVINARLVTFSFRHITSS